MIDNIYVILFYMFRFFINNTPFFLLKLILNFLVWIIYFIDKKHRRIIEINLKLAYNDSLNLEEKNKIIIGCYKSLVYNLADFIKNQGITKEEILKKVSFLNEEILLKSLKENRKIIFMTAHYGNWELLPLAIAAKFTPLTGVGRDLDSKIMNNILSKNREQFDIQLLSKNGAMKGLIKALKSNRPVGLLVDQNTKSTEGILIDFFGKKARHTPSIAILAKKFNAIIIPAFIQTNDYKNYVIKFLNPIESKNSENYDEDILNCVQEQAFVTEQLIREKPEEWFWFHKRWKNQYEHLYGYKRKKSIIP